MAFFPQCMYAPHSPLSSPLFFQGGRVRFSNNRESTGVISLRSAGDISLPQRGPPRRGLIVPQQPPNPPTIIPLTHARWVSPLRKFGFPGGQWPVVDCHYYLQLSLWPKGRHRCEGGALINKTRPLEWAVMIWQIQLPNLNPKLEPFSALQRQGSLNHKTVPQTSPVWREKAKLLRPANTNSWIADRRRKQSNSSSLASSIYLSIGKRWPLQTDREKVGEKG